MITFKADKHCCEEAALNAPEGMYLPCNQPAEQLVYHKRDNRTYRMCKPCAWHNLKNRGGEDKGPYKRKNNDPN